MDRGLPKLASFFKFNSTKWKNSDSIITYPNDAMDYLYFHSVTTGVNQPQSADTFKFKANWAEIVTELYKEPLCSLDDDSRDRCVKNTQPGFRSGLESACLYQPKVHCSGEWKKPPTVVDADGLAVPNTCGATEFGVEIKQYVELSASKLDAINNVWKPGNYETVKGAQCEQDDIGWLVYTDLDASASGTVATDTFRTEKLNDGVTDNPKYNANRKHPDGYTGTPSRGFWKKAAPRHGDLKYVACNKNCVEVDVQTVCEKSGAGNYDERNRMLPHHPPDSYDDENYDFPNTYDFSNAWVASENNCSGNYTTYKAITEIAQGKDGKQCPTFTPEQSRGNMDEEHEYDSLEKFTRGEACKLYKRNCVAGSSCIVNTDKITELVRRINQKPKDDPLVGDWLLPAGGCNGDCAKDMIEDDDTLRLTIDGTTYSHENKITNEILFRLAKKECDRFGDLYGFPNKAFCTEDKEIFISETDPTVPPCEYKAGSCYVDQYTTTYTSRPGIQVSYREKVYSKYRIPRYSSWLFMRISHTSFCKWIDMPDIPSE
jgi:hypothetical protein